MGMEGKGEMGMGMGMGRGIGMEITGLARGVKKDKRGISQLLTVDDGKQICKDT